MVIFGSIPGYSWNCRALYEALQFDFRGTKKDGCMIHPSPKVKFLIHGQFNEIVCDCNTSISLTIASISSLGCNPKSMHIAYASSLY